MSVIEKHLSDKLLLTEDHKQYDETMTDWDGSQNQIPACVRWVNSQIEPLLSIRSNWDGYGADEPSRIAITVATDTLKMLALNGYMCPPEISPTRTGGVALFWYRDSAELEVEVKHNGRVVVDTDELGTASREHNELSPNSGDAYRFASIFQSFFSS